MSQTLQHPTARRRAWLRPVRSRVLTQGGLLLLSLYALCDGRLGSPIERSLEAAPPPPSPPPKSPRWTAEDFAGVLSVGLEGHRSFEKGRSLFTSTGCANCHVFQTHGTQGTRSLTEFARNATPEEMLDGLLSASSHQKRGRPLADGFDQEQILDLLAFLLSGGNPKHSFFHGNR